MNHFDAMDDAVTGRAIEHAPDVIGWLMDLHGALPEDGLICLAIADGRFRPGGQHAASSAGEMLEAHLLPVRRLPARHLFDAAPLDAVLSKAQGWEDEMAAQAPPQEPGPSPAHRLAERVASAGDGTDVPCWVFTPESFLDVADRLSRIGFFPFAIEHFQPTEPGEGKFRVRLRKSHDLEAISSSLHSARDLLNDSPAEQAHRERLRAKVRAQMLPEPSYGHLLDELDQQKQQLRDEQRRLEAEIRCLQGVLDDVHASTSWRVTGPVRWLGRLLKRRG